MIHDYQRKHGRESPPFVREEEIHMNATLNPNRPKKEKKKKKVGWYVAC